MTAFLARRTATLGVTVLLASFVVFLIPYVTPGDPVRKIIRSRVAGEVVDDAAAQGLALELGLQDPLAVQYLRWLGRLAGGDLGLSYASRTPVIEQVLPALWITVSLVVVSLGVAAAVSVVLGTVAALQEGRPADRVITTVTQAFIAMPEYWLAPMLVLVFALQLSLLPSAGWEGPASAVLPVAVLALRPISYFTSAVREGMLEALGAEHVAAARARGLSHAPRAPQRSAAPHHAGGRVVRRSAGRVRHRGGRLRDPRHGEAAVRRRPQQRHPPRPGRRGGGRGTGGRPDDRGGPGARHPQPPAQGASCVTGPSWSGRRRRS
jgi:peptide/nickel transport system permease protein